MIDLLIGRCCIAIEIDFYGYSLSYCTTFFDVVLCFGCLSPLYIIGW